MFFLLPCLLAADVSPADPPQDFQDLRQLPGLRFEIGYATAANFTGAVLPGYEHAGAWLRKEAAQSLAQIQTELAKEAMALVIYDAYRPARASAAMVIWARATGHDAWLKEGYIAEYSNHSRGTAVDVSLSLRGNPLDMGSGWDQFGPSARTTAVTGTALENRLRLRNIMVAAGWTPYGKEWWHFDFPLPDLPLLDLPYGSHAAEH